MYTLLAISEFKHCSFEKSVLCPLKCRRDPPHFFQLRRHSSTSPNVCLSVVKLNFTACYDYL